MLRIVIRFLQLTTFLLILVFSSLNGHVVALHFFFGWEWQAPLILLLLVFFVAGALLAVLGCLPTLFTQRRELGKLRQRAALPATSRVLKNNQGANHLPLAPPPDHEVT